MKRVKLTDLTLRDAHQSLLATRMRMRDMLPVIEKMDQVGFFSMEVWGGATFDACIRFLNEDPWERIRTFKRLMKRTPTQMLLRGQNLVGYKHYSDDIVEKFVEKSAANGVDIFRIFDALNDVPQMRPAIESVLATGTAVAEVALCYTGDLLNPSETLYTLDYYLKLAEQIVEAGAHILAIKDMAGLLRASAAEVLVTALRERFDLPVHLHTHDTPGGQLATLLAASRAGVDAVDVASAPMAGTISQPSASALVAALAHTDRDTGLSLQAVCDLEPYWEAVRRVYRPFESGLSAPTGRVYKHEIPGGQMSNLRQQAISLGLGEQFEKVEDWYAAANQMLGRPPKVTPSSKAVGDLAMYLAAVNADPAEFEAHPERYDIPDSVIGFMAGELGDLPGGWPEPFRSKILKGRKVDIGIKPISDADRQALAGDTVSRRHILNKLLFPEALELFEEVGDQYGDLSVVDTVDYLYGLERGAEHLVEISKGVVLYIGLEAIGEADERGIRTVMTTLNGQLRPVYINDRSIVVRVHGAEKADPSKPGQVAAPFSGFVTFHVQVGDSVSIGQSVATIEGMKMETTITAPVGGTVRRIVISETRQVNGGDLLMEIEAS